MAQSTVATVDYINLLQYIQL